MYNAFYPFLLMICYSSGEMRLFMCFTCVIYSTTRAGCLNLFHRSAEYGEGLRPTADERCLCYIYGHGMYGDER